MEWQPIETAPRDGTEILIYLGSPWAAVEKAQWYEPWRNWQKENIDWSENPKEQFGIGSAIPTHWMPLPAPPEQVPE